MARLTCQACDRRTISQTLSTSRQWHTVIAFRVEQLKGFPPGQARMGKEDERRTRRPRDGPPPRHRTLRRAPPLGRTRQRAARRIALPPQHWSENVHPAARSPGRLPVVSQSTGPSPYPRAAAGVPPASPRRALRSPADCRGAAGCEQYCNTLARIRGPQVTAASAPSESGSSPQPNVYQNVHTMLTGQEPGRGAPTNHALRCAQGRATPVACCSSCS